MYHPATSMCHSTHSSTAHFHRPFLMLYFNSRSCQDSAEMVPSTYTKDTKAIEHCSLLEWMSLTAVHFVMTEAIAQIVSMCETVALGTLEVTFTRIQTSRLVYGEKSDLAEGSMAQRDL